MVVTRDLIPARYTIPPLADLAADSVGGAEKEFSAGACDEPDGTTGYRGELARRPIA
jgi:hypothetical protein